MTKHLVMRHKAEAQELKKDAATVFLTLSTYLLLTRYVDVPPTETVLLGVLEEVTQTLVSLFAPEPKPVA